MKKINLIVGLLLILFFLIGCVVEKEVEISPCGEDFQAECLSSYEIYVCNEITRKPEVRNCRDFGFPYCIEGGCRKGGLWMIFER